MSNPSELLECRELHVKLHKLFFLCFKLVLVEQQLIAVHIIQFECRKLNFKLHKFLFLIYELLPANYHQLDNI
ncbi:hypothetical protein M7I_7720 [Glarea lozoyensis 74030]|uniref:Uncharacterized protein n=1 Tax=Glarea lozoyensis (strain ATCC 74030 / MF5533) TaxID=1104152 RepID=H0EY24_GLAL7|nr:hypothetical protein M7I_7720 [Glarea lozoyensis 74030]